MIKLTALLVALALGLSACGSSDSSDSSTSSSGSSAATSSTTSAAKSSDDSSSTEVEMYDNYFKPKTISGAPGSTVKIELKNEGKNEHNFKIDSQKQADADVEPGKSSSISVMIPASGSVQFYCEYHKGLGMVGTVKAS
jgi:plastocyanin